MDRTSVLLVSLHVFVLVTGVECLFGSASLAAITVKQNSTTVIQGQSVYLLVNIHYPKTSYILSWQFEQNGQEIVRLNSGSVPQYSKEYQKRSSLFPQNGTLRLDSTELSDAGRYIVRLYDDDSINISAIVQLSIYGSASSAAITVKQNSTTVREGHSVYLLVNIHYPKTSYILSWQFEQNGQDIVRLNSGSVPQYSKEYQKRSSLFPQNGTLRLDSTKKRDAGRYIVRLYDEDSINISAVVELSIYGVRTFCGEADESASIPGKIEYKVDEFAQEVLTSGLTTIFLPLVYIIVFIVGLPANAMALWVFFFRIKIKHPAVIYMACLALADLLFAIWLPLKIAYHINGNNWIYGENLCKVLVGFFYGSMYCSILFITCLSVQRYWVVVNPMSQTKKSNKIALGVSAAIWVVIAISTIPLYITDQTVYVTNLNITTCHDVLPDAVLANDMFGYFLSLAIGVFFFPAILTICVYTALIKTLSASLTEQDIGKKRKRAIHLIIVVLVMYLICFTPSNIILVVHYALIHSGSTSNVYVVYITVLCLSSLNSCIDPFVYYFVSEDFRVHVKNTFLCRSVRTVESMQASYKSIKFSRKYSSTKSSSTKANSQSTSQTNC